MCGAAQVSGSTTSIARGTLPFAAMVPAIYGSAPEGTEGAPAGRGGMRSAGNNRSGASSSISIAPRPGW